MFPPSMRTASADCGKWPSAALSTVSACVFECSLDAAQYKLLQAELRQLIDPEKDSLRFYNLGNHYESRIEHIGVKTSYAPEGLLML